MNYEKQKKEKINCVNCNELIDHGEVLLCSKCAIKFKRYLGIANEINGLKKGDFMLIIRGLKYISSNVRDFSDKERLRATELKDMFSNKIF